MTTSKAFKGGYKIGSLGGAAPFEPTVQAGGKHRRGQRGHRGHSRRKSRSSRSSRSGRKSRKWSLDTFFKGLKG